MASGSSCRKNAHAAAAAPMRSPWAAAAAAKRASAETGAIIAERAGETKASGQTRPRLRAEMSASRTAARARRCLPPERRGAVCTAASSAKSAPTAWVATEDRRTPRARRRRLRPRVSAAASAPSVEVPASQPGRASSSRERASSSRSRSRTRSSLSSSRSAATACSPWVSWAD